MRSWFTVILANLSITLLLILLVEGSFSWLHTILLVYREWHSTSTAEDSCCRFDPHLGWVLRRGVRLEDFYGPGQHLTIDPRGVRLNGDAHTASPGKYPLLVVGDSFVFGDEVGDHETWCAKLEVFLKDITCLNLGVPGYGFDQSWLRYRTEAVNIPHKVAVIGGIIPTYDRIRFPTFGRLSKPVLRAEAGELQLINLPIPLSRASWLQPSWQRNVALFQELRSVRMFTSWLAEAPALPGNPYLSEDDARTTLTSILISFRERAQRNGARPIFVLLPRHLYREDWERPILATLRDAAQKAQVEFIDMSELFYTHTRSRAIYFATRGHPNSIGNTLIAKRFARSISSPVLN